MDSIRPAFAIVTGDLVRDAMSQTEELSRSYFELFKTEMRTVAPLWTVPGNHDHFGLVRSRSNIPKTHPLYDRGMYRSYLGPDYYSFNFGGVHFVGLNTLMPGDSAYYGRVDSVQLAWLRRIWHSFHLTCRLSPSITYRRYRGGRYFTGLVTCRWSRRSGAEKGRATNATDASAREFPPPRQ